MFYRILRGVTPALMAVAIAVSGCSLANPLTPAPVTPVTSPGPTDTPAPTAPSPTAPLPTAPSPTAPLPTASVGEPSLTASPVPAATPGASDVPMSSVLNQTVVTFIDKLRVRSEPRVGDDSIRYEPVLPRGTELTILDGPVDGSGYVWYKVAPVSFIGLDGPGYGWVAKAAKDGAPWIALVEPPNDWEEFAKADCPPVPTDVDGLMRLQLNARVVCFSRVPITVRARVIECPCSVMGGGYLEPAWFNTGDGPLLLAQPSNTMPTWEDSLSFIIDPAGRHPDVVPLDKLVEVTGEFDHPDAANCLYYDMYGDEPLPMTSEGCRLRFAVTSLVVVGK